MLIDGIMRRTALLALNARLEAAWAGSGSAAVGVVAQEMGMLAGDIHTISADLARSAVEIMDRNLYERSCDVRWWATDSAVVNVLAGTDPARVQFATQRLATILRSYTVYLDLWVADRNGRVVATGRPDLYPRALGADVSGCAWFERGMGTKSGDDFAVCDIQRNPWLGQAAVATYSTAIRAGGARAGEPLGALGIFFDWAPQAAAAVEGIGLSADERDSSRVMLLSADNLVLASSDGRGVLEQRYELHHGNRARGFYGKDYGLVAFARTPGSELIVAWAGGAASNKRRCSTIEQRHSKTSRIGMSLLSSSCPQWVWPTHAAPAIKRIVPR